MAIGAAAPARPGNRSPLLGGAIGRLWRARRLVERNLMVYRHQTVVIFSGVLEPLFYLAGIGFGLGGIVKTVDLSDGRTIPYAAFVAPALLATAAMNGAVFETIFNVFFKLNYAKTYDGILATPMGISEIALGEMLWALMRAALYAAVMLVVMLVLGLILSPWAILAFPVALLLAAAFASAGLAGTSFLRTVQDFDIPMGLIVQPMFLFSGTFFPVTVYPPTIQMVMEVNPLFHGIRLIRGLSVGIVGWDEAWDAAFLVAFFLLMMWIAMRQMERKLIR
ncbi:MAG TPA: ABC transporter permease [Candidatus Limnocylindria bacterium]|nr:ABC transporter permease [Candidatus Limnocylindria bacterium]